MKIAIVGSRSFNDYNYLEEEINKYNDITTLISGGARGADLLAENYATLNCVPIVVHKANWKKYGKSAGFIRNELIIKSADLVLAFWDGISKGTAHSIKLCLKHHIALKICRGKK